MDMKQLMGAAALRSWMKIAIIGKKRANIGTNLATPFCFTPLFHSSYRNQERNLPCDLKLKNALTRYIRILTGTIRTKTPKKSINRR